jgi:hypothetical protein
MGKFTLAISIAAASLMVTACGKTSEAPKDEATTVDATEATAPLANTNSDSAPDVNSTDAKMTGSGAANSMATDKDKGGDPGARVPGT